MFRLKMLKIINPLLALSALSQIITGLFAHYVPPWAFRYGHALNGWILSGLIVTHVALNWGWIKTVLLGRKPGA